MMGVESAAMLVLDAKREMVPADLSFVIFHFCFLILISHFGVTILELPLLSGFGRRVENST